MTRVLLVDDARDFVKYTSRRLGVRGYEVLEAHDGPSALALLREAEVDVVVLDILMPGMDGIETLRAIRRGRATLPVIMLSGHGTAQCAAEGEELGAAEYLLKPVELATLMAAIDKAVGNGQEQRGMR